MYSRAREGSIRTQIGTTVERTIIWVLLKIF